MDPEVAVPRADPEVVVPRADPEVAVPRILNDELETSQQVLASLGDRQLHPIKKPLKIGKSGLPWTDDAAADTASLAEAVMKRAEDERKRLLWPKKPNFRSVLAIGYRPTDSFRWHTDLAGEDGWVCSLSVGATAIFEYLPTAAPSALRRARAIAGGEEVVQVEVGSGDALLFHGGLLAHRLSSVEPEPDAEKLAGCHLDPYVRLNLQTRVYGAGLDSGLQELLKKGFEYAH